MIVDFGRVQNHGLYDIIVTKIIEKRKRKYEAKGGYLLDALEKKVNRESS